MRAVRAALLCAGALGLAACAGAAPRPGRSGALEGPTLSHPVAAPGFALRSYEGRLVRLASYRGKAVLLTFIYTHCHDVCPTIVAELHAALAMLGRRAREVEVVGVSVDPRGDTRSAVAAFLARHEMTGRMQYLVGRRAALLPVWRRWGVDAARPTASDTVSHTAVVFGISAQGRVLTAYPANFTPAQIVHDVPILARRAPARASPK